MYIIMQQDHYRNKKSSLAVVLNSPGMCLQKNSAGSVTFEM